MTFFENRPIIKEAAINTLLIFAFQEDWKKQEILRNSAENHCFSLRKNDAEKVVDTMGEELQEQLQTRILWESPFDVPLVGPLHISASVVMTWFLMASIMVLVLILTRNLKIVPGKRQAFLEMAVTWLTNFFEGNMGKAGRRYVPYLSTVLIYLGIANMIGMFGFGMKPPTKDINVTVALALMSIVLIEASTFRAQGGIKGFLKSFTKPMALLTPLNVMENAIRTLSLCMRLFGNVLGDFIVMKLLKLV